MILDIILNYSRMLPAAVHHLIYDVGRFRAGRLCSEQGGIVVNDTVDQYPLQNSGRAWTTRVPGYSDALEKTG